MNNIMWFKREMEIIGVLCDWDLAEDQSNGDLQAVDTGPLDVAAPPDKRKGKAVPLRVSQLVAGKPSDQQNERAAAASEAQVQPRYRTGTGPFMALDLLDKGKPPPHIYRYDLESFFYLYICSAATYSPDSKQKIRVIPQWDKDLASIAESKRQFFAEKEKFNILFQNVHPDYRGVVDSVLRKMWIMFRKVEAFALRGGSDSLFQEDEDPDARKARLAGLEEDKMGVANYDEFMKILGVVGPVE